MGSPGLVRKIFQPGLRYLRRWRSLEYRDLARGIRRAFSAPSSAYPRAAFTIGPQNTGVRTGNGLSWLHIGSNTMAWRSQCWRSVSASLRRSRSSFDVLALLPKIGQPAVVFPPSYRSGLRPRLRGPVFGEGYRVQICHRHFPVFLHARGRYGDCDRCCEVHHLRRWP